MGYKLNFWRSYLTTPFDPKSNGYAKYNKNYYYFFNGLILLFIPHQMQKCIKLVSKSQIIN